LTLSGRSVHGVLPSNLEDAIFGHSLATYGWVYLIVGIVVILAGFGVMVRLNSHVGLGSSQLPSWVLVPSGGCRFIRFGPYVHGICFFVIYGLAGMQQRARRAGMTTHRDGPEERAMTSAEVTNVEEMFVQVARGSSNSKSELTLNGVSPSTLYFSDRPDAW